MSFLSPGGVPQMQMLNSAAASFPVVGQPPWNCVSLSIDVLHSDDTQETSPEIVQCPPWVQNSHRPEDSRSGSRRSGKGGICKWVGQAADCGGWGSGSAGRGPSQHSRGPESDPLYHVKWARLARACNPSILKVGAGESGVEEYL